MKYSFFAIALAGTLLYSCSDAPKGDEATTTGAQEAASLDGESYSVDSTSTITWVGTKANGAHTGTFSIEKGELVVKDGQLTAGKFLISTASLKNQDLSDSPEDQGKLEGHLKSADFFDVEKFPNAVFEITEVTPYDASQASGDAVVENPTHLIKGNLTLKDSTKNVAFPAHVTVADNKVAAAANFNIDRTLWGMNYKGPNNPQDWFIRKEVNIKFDLQASK